MGFDLDREIAARLGGESASDVELQAQAILIDAGLSDDQRSGILGRVLTTILASLSQSQLEQFLLLAQKEGEGAAMAYLGSVTRPAIAERL